MFCFPLLSRRRWLAKQSSLPASVMVGQLSWHLMLLRVAVTTWQIHWPLPLRFKTCEPETREGQKAWWGICGVRSFIWKAVRFKWPLAAVITVLPSSCEQIMVQCLPSIHEGRWQATRLWVVRALVQGLWLMRQGVAPQGFQQHVPHWW